MTAPSREEFEIWLDNPITQLVRSGCARLAEGQRAEWSEKAWSGDLDPITLERYRTRADAYDGLANLTYEQALEANGMEIPNSELDSSNAG